MTAKRYVGKWIAMLLMLSMVVAMLPTISVFADTSEVGDFTIEATNGSALADGTDYSFSNGTLNVKTTVPVKIGMKSGITTTDNIIVIDTANGEANITFDGVNVSTTKRNAVELKGRNKVTINFLGKNVVSAGSSAIEMNTAPLRVTSENAGIFKVLSAKYVIDSSVASNNPLEIDGNINIDVQNCNGSAIYHQGNTVTISGSPVINIDTSNYAIYGVGVYILGGNLTIKNKSGYAITSKSGSGAKIGGNAEIAIKSAQSGIQAAEAKLIVTDDAKIEMYDMVDGDKTAAIKRTSITCKEINVEKNAVVDIVSAETGISATAKSTETTEGSKISDNAKVFVVINTTGRYKNSLSFSQNLDILNNAIVSIEVIRVEGSSAYGIQGYGGALNISDKAVVNITGATKSVNAKINLSGDANMTAENDADTVVGYEISIADNAKIKLETTANKSVLGDKYTVKPAAGKAYMVKAGQSEDAAVISYYTSKSENSRKTSWRYFYAEPSTVVPVTVTGSDKEITYDGSTYDVSGMFDIDPNAGKATYSIVGQTGSDIGSGTVSGKDLTITKAGKITVKVNTAANGNFLPGEATAVLTVKKGTPLSVTFPTASEITYGDKLEDSVLSGGTGNGTFVWKNTETVPKVSNNGFTVVFVPNDADVCDYSGISLEKTVSVNVKPLPVIIDWGLPSSLIYDGTDKTLIPSVSNKVSGDEINLTVNGATAKEAGEYTAAVNGIDNENYTIENGVNLTKNYVIEAKTLSGDNITPIPDKTYTSEEIAPIIEVKDGENVLVLGVDYTVAYDNNINAGVAKVIVTFAGNYKGNAEKSFNILEKTIDANIDLDAPVKKAAPQTTIETDEYTATVVWSPEVSKVFGFNTEYTATVTIEPKENYTVNGISENGYIFDGADSVLNAANSDTVTVKYPATGKRSDGNTNSNGNRDCIITFDSNGGSDVVTQYVPKSTEVKEPKVPTKDGYVFAGWYVDKELKTEFDFSQKVIKSFTLYAAWTDKNDPVNQIILTIGDKTAQVFGKSKSNDVAPKIVNDRTMLPARFVAENLGAIVLWNGENEIVTINGKNLKTGEDVTILIYIDSDIAYVNGTEIKLDSPAFIENDRTYTPIRFISEQLGASVEWVEREQKVVITK